MLNKTKKGLSIFMSFLMVFAFLNFAIILNAEPVSAASACCILDNSGNYCVDGDSTELDDCASGELIDYTTCSALGGDCALQTCVPSVGTCLSDYPNRQCSDEGGVSYPGPKSGVSDCSLGCCNDGGICGVKESNECSGEFTAGVTNNVQCNSQCATNEIGCCELGGSCSFDFSSSCSLEGNFHANAVCSSINSCRARLDDPSGHSYKNCGDIEEGDAHKVYWYDSDGNRDDLVEDCNYPDNTCFDSDGDGGAEDASCISTACVEDCPECDPSSLKQGESICLTLYKGSYSNDQRSKYLKEYILQCQNGKIEAIEDIYHGEKVCIDNEDKDLGEFTRRSAKFVQNLASDCSSSGGPGKWLDVFGYVPVLGAPLVSLGDYSHADDGWTNAWWGGENCNDIVLEGSTDINMCEYDHDFWAPLGSCNPLYPLPTEEKCGECGKGGDPYTNACTEQECNALGDCQFEHQNLDLEALAIVGGLAIGSASATILTNTLLCAIGFGISCTPTTWGSIGAGIWGLLGNSLFWGVFGIVVGAGAGMAAEVPQYVFSNVQENGRVDLAKTYAIARSLESQALAEQSEGDFDHGWFLAGEGIVDLARLSLETGGILAAETIGRWLIKRAVENALKDAIKDLTGQAAIEAYNAAAIELTASYGVTIASATTTVPATAAIETTANTVSSQATPEIASNAGNTLSGIIQVLGIAYTIYQTSEAFQVGECTPEAAYTNNDHCWQCGGPEGQWVCSEERCQVLGGEFDHCEYLPYDNVPGDGACVEVDVTDFDAPIIDYINTEVYDMNENYVEEFEQSEASGRNELVIPMSGNYGWEEVGSVKINVNTTTPLDVAERANCKWSRESGSEFANMNPFELGNYPFSNHVNITLNEGDRDNGGVTFYIKCSDLSENVQGVTDDYYSVEVKFGDRPDYLPPTLWGLSPITSAFLPEGTNLLAVNIKVGDNNQVVGCKYSNEASEYSLMENSFTFEQSVNCPGESASSCSLYGANVVLEEGVSVEGSEDVSYLYNIACIDGSGNGGIVFNNVQLDSFNYSFTVVPTFNITIESPLTGSNTFDSTPLIQVLTSRLTVGCDYTMDGIEYEFNEMGSSSYVLEHPEELSGSSYGIAHTMSVTCTDHAFNEVTTSSTFYVVGDEIAPSPVRIFTAGNNLHIILDEENTACEYSNEVSNFVYGEGLEMFGVPPELSEHYAALGFNVYYIQCKDQFDNIGSFTVYP
ncbi:hypothetical protein HOD61_02925 [archaeon]|nr:hypothetical protein [archaeon]